MKLKGAQVLMECLKEQGVDVIFGYPGGAVLPIYDALYNTEGITHISTAHEQGATHAADGYARSTGKVGVVIATSGPGATNTVTGIATAYRDSSPLVVFTGQVSQSLLGKDSFQEVNITAITSTITKENYLVKNPLELASTIRKAFKVARQGRPGPVLVDMPKDIQDAEIDYEYMENNQGAFNKDHSNKIDEISIEKAVSMIKNSQKPVVYAGGGVIISGAYKELLEFAEKSDLAVTCSLMGVGGFPGDHPRYMGMVGMHGSPCSNRAVTNCDLLIAVGARFSDRVISKVEAFAPNANIIHIDIDPKEFGKNKNINLALNGDAKQVLSELNEKLEKQNHNGWISQIQKWKETKSINNQNSKELSPQFIFEKLNKLTNGDCIITTEVGQNQIWTAQYFKFLEPRTLITSGGLGTMGFGLGASIGVSIGNPDKKVINIAGDGSFKMNSNELATVSKYNIPIIQIVLNNHALGMVYQWQKLFYGGRFSQTELEPNVDFVKLAAAYGIEAVKVTNNDEVEEILKKALSLNKPVIIECEINRNDKVSPIVPPGVPIMEWID